MGLSDSSLRGLAHRAPSGARCLSHGCSAPSTLTVRSRCNRLPCLESDIPRDQHSLITLAPIKADLVT
jgi:hypothetical protein